MRACRQPFGGAGKTRVIEKGAEEALQVCLLTATRMEIRVQFSTKRTSTFPQVRARHAADRQRIANLLIRDEELLNALKPILELEIDLIATVTDGRVLIEKVQRLEPDIVVTDIGMPVMKQSRCASRAPILWTPYAVRRLCGESRCDASCPSLRLGRSDLYLSAYCRRRTRKSALISTKALPWW